MLQKKSGEERKGGENRNLVSRHPSGGERGRLPQKELSRQGEGAGRERGGNTLFGEEIAILGKVSGRT